MGERTPGLKPNQRVDIVCVCGATLRAEIGEWGALPVTTCPACKRRYAVGANVDLMDE